MPLLTVENGGPQQNNSFLPQDLSSEINEKWMTEQWLMNAGVVSESSVDTLLMYAYAQLGVESVKLEIDNAPYSNGKHPSLIYKITLTPWMLVMWKAVRKASKIKNGMLRKTALLGLAKGGAPMTIEDEIKRLATEYLPPIYTVKVEIFE